MSFLSNFNYQILGSEANPKLVFLHGVMGFGSNWKTMARHFSSKYQILLYDQRGHGRSFQPENYTLDDYAQDLDSITTELGWDKFVLVGHSLGGRVAVRFTTKFPQKVEKLIVVDIGPVSDLRTMFGVEEQIKFVPTPFANREEARAFFDGPFMAKYPNEMIKQFYYANLDVNAKGEFTWRFCLPGILKSLWQARVGDQWPDWEKLTVPTLLVRGELSKDLPEFVYNEVLQRNPHIQGVVVEGAGHWVHAQKHAELAEIFEKFI